MRLEIHQMEEENKALTQQREELAALQMQVNNSPTMDQFKAKIDAYKARSDKFNKRVADFNQDQKKLSPLLVEVGGGIDLGSESFKMSTVQNSPQLTSLKAVVKNARSDWTDTQNGEKWVTNKVRQNRVKVQNPTLFHQPEHKRIETQRRAERVASERSVKVGTTIVVKTNVIINKNIKGELIDPHHIVFKRVAEN